MSVVSKAQVLFRTLTVAACLSLPFCMLGCPGGLRGAVFYKGDIRYRIGEISKDWRQIAVSENDLAFYNQTYQALIQINSTCRRDYEDVSLQVLTDHVFYGLTDKKILLQEDRRIDRRGALYTEMTAKMDGQKVKAAVLVLKKNACIYDIAYITKPWDFGRGIGDYFRVIDGFRVLAQ